MQVEPHGRTVRLTLTRRELARLRLALERASFIDTPQHAQAEIADFCDAALAAIESVTTDETVRAWRDDGDDR